MPTILKKKKCNCVSRQRQAQFYNLPIWRKIRKYKLMYYPICQKCEKELADEVHHIVPFMAGVDYAAKYKLFTEVDNLLSVCSNCHAAIHSHLKEIKEKNN